MKKGKYISEDERGGFKSGIGEFAPFGSKVKTFS
jgi:hypothetical protein